MLRLDPGEHTAAIRRISADADGRWIATASEDKTVRVWSLADGRLLTTLRPPLGAGNEGKLYAVAMSPDGETVATAGWTRAGHEGAGNHNIYFFERATGRLLRRVPGLHAHILHLAFSPDGRWLAATLYGKNGVRVFSAAGGQLLAEDRDYDDSSHSAHFSADGRLLTNSFDGQLRLYRFDGKRLSLLAKRAAPGGTQPHAARFSFDGRRIAVGFHDTVAVNVLDGETLAFLFAPDTAGVNGKLGFAIAWSRDGAALFAAGWAQRDNQRYIRRWADGGAGAVQDWPVAKNTILDLVPLPGGRLAFGTFEPAWGVVDARGKRLLFHAPVVADFQDNWEGFKLSGDGVQVRFGYEKFGKSPAVFDTSRRDFLASDSPNLAAPRLAAPNLTVTDVKYSTAPKFNGAALELDLRERSISLALWPSGEGFVLGTEWSLRIYDNRGALRRRQPVPSEVWSLNVTADGRWVVAAYADGTIRWHRASDGAEQLAFFPHADRKRWVLWTPTGYYDAAPGAEDLMGWHLNRGKDNAADFFPISRFRGQFFRPDVIDRVLSSGNEGEALRLANIEAGRKPQYQSIIATLPPVLEIHSPSEGAAVATPSVTVRYSTRVPNDAPVTGLRARVNGLAVSLPEASNLAVSAADTRDITIPIPSQDSEIQLFAENRNGVSAPVVLRVTWAGAKPAPKEVSQFKPKLYVLAVGVSKYANPDFNLHLAAKDARDFAAVLQQQKGSLYSDVQVRLLTDSNATKDDVLDGLEWLRREVTARDVGMMFLAGHGMNDNTGKYYFLPHNADPNKLLRTGVAQGDIKDTLNALAGKALFFVDTCHSGNALGTSKSRALTTDINAFVNELSSAENGVVVFTASTGRQFSMEDLAWGNGAFTKAVVEGLSGRADFQKTGKITHKGLDYYVAERVKLLTGGKQSPMSITPQGVADFPIAVVR